MSASNAPFAGLLIPLSTPPMEAKSVDRLPEGEGWQFEPKWDGFRCLAFRDGDSVALMSKSGKPLERYFPEVAAMVRKLAEKQFVVDGEIVVPVGGTLSFAALQARLHPAASRVARLSTETPAQLILFDCLQLGAARVIDDPLDSRRTLLESFAAGPLFVSPKTFDRAQASGWLERTGGALDGVMAKRRDQPYRPGERAMFKHKVERTADCVVGGYRTDASSERVASLLLGLFDDDGLLHHVGFTSSFSAAERAELLVKFAPLAGNSAFTGSAPGGASRWAKPGASSEWIPVQPTEIAEVSYDQITGRRFRHGTTFRRWRPDKSPRQCTFEQLSAELRPEHLQQFLER